MNGIGTRHGRFGAIHFLRFDRKFNIIAFFINLGALHFCPRKPRNDWNCRVWTPLFSPPSIVRQLPVSDAT
jgi:hypothetical protein